VLRKGAWGAIIKKCQERIEPPSDVSFASNVERKIWQLKKATSPPIADWQISGVKQYSLLAPIAVRVCVLAVQSADVERVCKAHKVIHTKSRNLLLAKTVQMLLFTYCNLRLLNSCPELGDFLTSAMASCEDVDSD
jgi:hypothetical protein